MTKHKPKKNSPPKATTIEIEKDLAEALDKLAAIKGWKDRDALAQSILRRYLFPEIERTLYKAFPKHEIMSDDIALLGNLENYRLRVRLVEHGMPSRAQKSVEVQSVSTDQDEQERVRQHFVFSAVQLARARTVLVPWLDRAFADAEAAHKEHTRQNRLAAQEERKARTPEQVEAEARTRSEWTEKYGKELWDYARNQATRHRARARRRDLTEHFTAADWLTLAEQQGFVCAECEKFHEEDHLQSHHVRALMHEGANTIGNIVLLCSTCHITVADRGENYANKWFALEQQKAALFAPGDTVIWYEPVGTRWSERGEILEVLPPTNGNVPLWCVRMNKAHTERMWSAEEFLEDGNWRLQPPYEMLGAETKEHKGFIPTRLRVRWTSKKGATREGIVRPAQIKKVVIMESSEEKT